MQPDDDVCLCFHVSRRKLEKFVRIERPRRASQMSECGGAGTGCGWCRPILAKIFAAETDDLPDADAHTAGRRRHRESGGKP